MFPSCSFNFTISKGSTYFDFLKTLGVDSSYLKDTPLCSFAAAKEPNGVTVNCYMLFKGEVTEKEAISLFNEMCEAHDNTMDCIKYTELYLKRFFLFIILGISMHI